jgi:hypothetical protein
VLALGLFQFFLTFLLKNSDQVFKKLLLYVLLLITWQAGAQHFEVLDSPESYQTSLNQIIRIPIRIRNNSDKAQFYIVRRVKGEMGDSQKGYFCFNNQCLDPAIEEFSKKVEPGETLQEFYFAFETGIQSNQASIKFEIFPKGNPHDAISQSVSVSTEEKAGRSLTFQSKEITIHDIYPNPVQDQAFIDYKIHTESVKAKITLHNILGKPMGDYELPYSETRLKIQAEDLMPGVYFYTVYLNSNGILTRKLIVRK